MKKKLKVKALALCVEKDKRERIIQEAGGEGLQHEEMNEKVPIIRRRCE